MVSEQLVALSICFLCLSVRESLCIWLSADQYHDQLLIYRQVTDWKGVFIGINFYVMLNVIWLICSGNGKRTSTFVTTLIPSMVCLTYRFGVWVILHPLSVTFQFPVVRRSSASQMPSSTFLSWRGNMEYGVFHETASITKRDIHIWSVLVGYNVMLLSCLANKVKHVHCLIRIIHSGSDWGSRNFFNVIIST